MLAELTVEQLGGGINLVDVGASGELDPQWKPIERRINLFAFEPNVKECERLRQTPNQFHSATYLPYAVSDSNGEAILYATESIYCYSLLKPNLDWLRRFSYSDLFELTGELSVRTSRLSDVTELRDVNVDVIKTDSQGLDMAILAKSGSMLDDAFFVETEPGFVECYLGENTFSQVDAFMRSRGFLLFDLNLHRVSRKNSFAASPTGKEQILWAETTWLKDYIGLERQGQLPSLSRQKALKALLLCGLLDCIDYGYELAAFFRRKELLTGDELKTLQERENWRLNFDSDHGNHGTRNGRSRIAANLLNYGLRLLPAKMRTEIADAARQAARQPHVVKSLYPNRQNHS